MAMIRVPDAERDAQHDYLIVPIVKGTFKDDSGGIEVDIDRMPTDVYREALLQGLKVILNRGMNDIKDKDSPKNRALAMEKAQSNLDDLYAGKIRMSKGVRSKGLSGEVKTEAMKAARQMVKDQIKAEGLKVSHYTAKDISTMAAELVESEDWGPGILADAKATVEARKAKGSKIKEAKGIDISKLKADPSLVAKSAAKSKKPKAAKVPLGEVMARARPGTERTAH